MDNKQVSKPKSKKELKKEKAQEPQTFGMVIYSWAKTILGAIIVVTILNGLALASFVVPTGSMERTVMTGDFLFVNKFVYGPSTPQVIPFVNIPLPFYRFPGIKNPEKNDVIVFIFPGNRDEVEATEFQYYLKRCVATAGDTLEIKDKRVYINHAEFQLPVNGGFDPSMGESPIDKMQTFPYGKGYTKDNYGPIRIPKKGDVVPLNMQNINEWLIFIGREGHKVTSDGNNIYIDGKASTQYVVLRDYCFGMGDNRDHSLDSRYWGFIPYENVVGTPIIVYWSWDTNSPFVKLFDKIASTRWSRIGKIIR